MARRKVFSEKKRNRIYWKTEGICYLCNTRVLYSEFTIDHRIPLSKGGRNHTPNLFAVHFECNNAKGNTVSDEHALASRITQLISKNAALKVAAEKRAS